MDAIHDEKIFWPPVELWRELRNVQRVEFGAGIALIVVNLVFMVARKRTT
jgi:hypothetical protein